MLKNILKLNGIQELNSELQKEIIGGGEGGYNSVISSPIEDEKDTLGWKFRCYSSQSQSSTYYMSMTDLSLTNHGYVCYPV